MASQPQERAPASVDIDAARQRLIDYKNATGLGWTKLAPRIGIPSGTLSAFGTANYAGDNARIALQIDKWFAAEEAAESMRKAAPIEPPSFQMTRAAEELTRILQYARRGKQVAAATCPGFGKTSALKQYAEDVPNVWLATMFPSTAGVQTMLAAVLKVMGEKELRGSPQMLSERIQQRVQGTGGLICIDEAHHLSLKALDELRGIHDVTGVGVALFGNAGLIETLEGGTRNVSHAQLFSRFSFRIVKTKAYPEDGMLLGRAWGIEDPMMLEWLGSLTLKPGGLRGVSMVIELASLLAAGEERPLAHCHLQDAWAQLSLRPAA